MMLDGMDGKDVMRIPIVADKLIDLPRDVSRGEQLG